MRSRVAIIILIALQIGCGQDSSAIGKESVKPEANLSFVDDYLSKWDRFAQGENELASTIRDKQKQFESELVVSLRKEPEKYIPRAVFYGVVQVGGFFDTSSELGLELKRIAGDDLPVSNTKRGETYFAGDLYIWWENTAGKWSTYSLLEEWRGRDFAKKVVSMYKSINERSSRNAKKSN